LFNLVSIELFRGANGDSRRRVAGTAQVEAQVINFQTMIDPIISLNGLGRRFGHTIAVDGISMVIDKGEIFGFLGANGAGKTTTIRMLCGLTRPTCGHGAINGLDIWRQRSRVHWQFGYVPQRFSLYADLTVLENMRFFGCAYRVCKDRLRARIDRLVSELNLSANQDTRAGSLSGGFKQLLSQRLRSALRSGRLRIQARDPEALLDGWLKRWPYENLRWLGYSWVEPDMEDVFMAHSQRYFAENGLGKQKNTDV
jgi:ABC-type transport system involved in cytochrome c biogenesis ATPase subunit